MEYGDNSSNKTYFPPLGAFHRRPKEKQKPLPGFLGMQYLKEPVCFYQKIAYTGPISDAIENIYMALLHAGHQVSAMWGLTSTEGVKYINKYDISNPNTYIIHETVDGFIELITPFYKPEKARDEISKVIRTISDIPKIHITGAVSPTHFYQIAPHTQRRLDNDSKMRLYDKIIDKYQDDAISLKRLIKQYQDSNEYLFRGHSFMYADKMAPYATPTKRAGRTGKAYGTDDINYALLYSGHNKYVASRSHAPNTLKYTDENDQEKEKDIGFLTVYKKSKKNLMFRNFGIEDVDNTDIWYSMKKLLGGDRNDRNDNETLLTPGENPVVATYFLTDKIAIKVDLNDPLWCEFVDCFAPDLDEMYNTEKEYIRKRNPNNEYGSTEYGQLYNLRLINQKEMLEKLKQNQKILLSKNAQRDL